MPIYRIQHRIRVLLSNNANVSAESSDEYHSFTVDGVTFKSWEQDFREKWRAGAWLVEASMDADSLDDAFRQYVIAMSRIVPRIAFVGQAYINDRNGLIFIKREDKDFGWLRSIVSSEAVSLSFMDEEKQALDLLLAEKSIPDTFYYYWNDAVNTTSYTGKLLLLFGAIDSLAIRGQRRAKRNEILGEALATEIYNDDTGLRNRLTHGEYLNETDGKNYVELVHKQVLEYFNKTVLNMDILELDIVQPQRHFDENYEGARLFIAQKSDEYPLDIYAIAKDIWAHGGIPEEYEILYGNEHISSY